MTACLFKPINDTGDEMIIVIFLVVMDLVVRLFLFNRNLVNIGSSVIIFIVSFESVNNSSSSK